MYVSGNHNDLDYPCISPMSGDGINNNTVDGVVSFISIAGNPSELQEDQKSVSLMQLGGEISPKVRICHSAILVSWLMAGLVKWTLLGAARWAIAAT